MILTIKYIGYILTHKYFVLLEGRKLGLGFIHLLKHDLSKLSRYEFKQYRNYFYPSGEEKNKKEFETAWQHHQKHNKHHWQYWLKDSPQGKTANLMPEKYALEMLADWFAMSRKFGNDPKKHYQSRKDKMILHPETRTFIESKLSQFAQKFE